MKIRVCENCGKPVFVTDVEKNLFYCSHENKEVDISATSERNISIPSLDKKIKSISNQLTNYHKMRAMKGLLHGLDDVRDNLAFLERLPAIIRSALVLAVYAGEDWGQEGRGGDFNFGADGYEYMEKYIKGGQIMHETYGTEDFYDYFQEFYESYISPKRSSDYTPNGWIPIASGKLPEELEPVLITYIDNVTKQPFCACIAYRDEDSEEWYSADSQEKISANVTITAWKPLCKPYEVLDRSKE